MMLEDERQRSQMQNEIRFRVRIKKTLIWKPGLKLENEYIRKSYSIFNSL